MSQLSSYVAMVTGDFVTTGGMDRANYALASYLARNGVRLELVAHRVAPELLSYPNVTFHKVPKPANSYSFGARLLAIQGRKIGEQVAKRGGRVIVNGGNCRFGDVNWVHYVHAAYAPEASSLLSSLRRRLMHHHYLRSERAALSVAKHVIVNSHVTKRVLINKLGIPDEKISVVYYGIDKDLFYPASEEERRKLRCKLGWDDSRRVVFVGALGDRRKGFDTLATAWSMLCQNKKWNAKLIVIGSGRETFLWRTFLEQQRCGDSFEFLGFCSNVSDYVRAADCFVAPTRYEAYGLGVHEAICSGLPAFVSGHAGVAERYPTEFSELLLESPNDPTVLANKLLLWQSMSNEWTVRLKPFSECLQAHSWDSMAKQIIENIT